MVLPKTELQIATANLRVGKPLLEEKIEVYHPTLLFSVKLKALASQTEEALTGTSIVASQGKLQ